MKVKYVNNERAVIVIMHAELREKGAKAWLVRRRNYSRRNPPRKSWNRTCYDGCHTFQAVCSRHRPKKSISEIPMTPILIQCDCTPCTCSVEEATAVMRGNKHYCSEACATGHINQESCHGTTHCDCQCGGWPTKGRSACGWSDFHPQAVEIKSGCHH